MAEQHRVKESPLKWISGLLVAAGLACVAGSIYYAIREYDARSAEQVDALNAQTAAMKNESQRKYYEEKQAAYARVTEAASKIAALKSQGANAAQLQDAVTEFKTLPGPLSITAGPDANTALALFNGALDADADAGRLQQLSLDLAHVCANEAREALRPAGQTGPGADYGPSNAILAEMRETAGEPEALHAAMQWLALLDGGQYGESWKTASAAFQSAMPQDQWERKIGGLRKALGSVGSRKFKSEDYTKPAPDSPESGRIVMQYDTSFAEKNDGIELVTTMCDKDGLWRVSAYSIK